MGSRGVSAASRLSAGLGEEGQKGRAEALPPPQEAGQYCPLFGKTAEIQEKSPPGRQKTGEEGLFYGNRGNGHIWWSAAENPTRYTPRQAGEGVPPACPLQSLHNAVNIRFCHN